MTELTTPAQGYSLGEEATIWFKLTSLLRGNPHNPMATLQTMTERYAARTGGVIPVTLGS